MAGIIEEHSRSFSAHWANTLCRYFTCTKYEYFWVKKLARLVGEIKYCL